LKSVTGAFAVSMGKLGLMAVGSLGIMRTSNLCCEHPKQMNLNLWRTSFGHSLGS